MPYPLYRFIYRSSFLPPEGSGDRDTEIAAILEASRRNNAASGLTGVLAHNGASFVQVLEGPLDALEGAYDRISADIRHTAFELVQFIQVTERRYPDWNMGYLDEEMLRERPEVQGIRPDTIEAFHAASAQLLGDPDQAPPTARPPR